MEFETKNFSRNETSGNLILFREALKGKKEIE